MNRVLAGCVLLVLIGCGGGGGNGGTGGGSSGTGGGSSGTGGGSSGTGGGTSGTGGGMACNANTMTDENNCGRCGRVCESGTCSNGLCEPTLVLDVPYSPSQFLYQVSISGGKVYEWQYTTAPADIHFFVYSAPAPLTNLTTSSSGTLIQDTPPPSNPNLSMTTVTFDSTYVYEVEPAVGSVTRKKLDGSEPTGAATALFGIPAMDPGGPAQGTIPARPASAYRWKGIAVEGTSAYVAGTTSANGSSWPHDDVTVIYKISPFPTSATTVATKLSGLDKLGYIFTDFMVANGNLFWFDNSVDSVKRSLFTVPVAGGTPVKLEDDVNASDHAAIVSDGTYVYWTISGSAGSVRRCPLADLREAAATEVVQVESSTEGLAVDDTHVYFMTTDSFKTVQRVPKAGGSVQELGSMVLPPSHIGNRVHGTDANFVYLSDSDGKVYRMGKVP